MSPPATTTDLTLVVTYLSSACCSLNITAPVPVPRSRPPLTTLFKTAKCAFPHHSHSLSHFFPQHLSPSDILYIVFICYCWSPYLDYRFHEDKEFYLFFFQCYIPNTQKSARHVVGIRYLLNE